MAAATGLPSLFDLVLTRPTRANPAFVSAGAHHNLARAGTLRRKLTIPNPVNQYQVAIQIVDNWQDIDSHCKQSTISLTTPTFSASPGKRAVAGREAFSELPAARAKTRAGARFVLSTDLNSFYQTVYTHSIPWALHTKAVSKMRTQDYGLLGNRLDLALRNGQAQQTVGIPIGPDTSLVIAEMISTAVDLRLPTELRNAFRYIDDIECGFKSASEAEGALASLQNEFAQFELNLNPRKTRVVELPLPLEAWWVPHLRVIPIRDGSQRTDLIGFFSRAFELAKDHRDEAILKYAIQRMRSVVVKVSNWPIYEDILLSCLAIESGTTPAVVRELLRYGSLRPQRGARIAEAFSTLIKFHAPLHHGSEIAWSAWYMAQAQYALHKDAAELALQIPDPVVALCLLYAKSKGQTDASVDWSALEAKMLVEELQGVHWLLAYEAKLKGWLPTFTGGDHLAMEPRFDYLKNANVTFFDEGATLKPMPFNPDAFIDLSDVEQGYEDDGLDPDYVGVSGSSDF